MSHSGLIDTHAHLCDDRFDEDRDEVLKRAFEAGVTGIILVSETLEDAYLNQELAKKESKLHLSVGLYPGYANLEKAAEMIGYIRDHRENLVGIGEVGLDFQLARETSEREIQIMVFKQFIDLSLELDLPLNVHSRAAAKQTVDLLMESGAKKVQLHAYHGKHAVALKAIEAGFFFSVPTSIVRSEQMQDLFKKLPLSHLMLESDSPVLGPEVGQRNEPANIARSIPVLAQLKDQPIGTVTEILFKNSLKLYGDNFNIDIKQMERI
jgi:TatD DNase family protein